jgi:hypothetical protein
MADRSNVAEVYNDVELPETSCNQLVVARDRRDECGMVEECINSRLTKTTKDNNDQHHPQLRYDKAERRGHRTSLYDGLVITYISAKT